MADGKDLGEADRAGQELGRVTAGEGVLVVLFRIVLITPTSGGGRRIRQMVGEDIVTMGRTCIFRLYHL